MMSKGNCEPNLNPPIPFVLPKRDDETSLLIVEIKILKYPTRKKATKDNTKKKELIAIETFTGSSTTTEGSQQIEVYPAQQHQSQQRPAG